MEEEIEKKRQTDRKRKGGIFGPCEWVVGVEMVVRPYLGKCNFTDPVTGKSINKQCVHVRVGVLGIILPNSVNTSWTRPNSDNFITITKKLPQRFVMFRWNPISEQLKVSGSRRFDTTWKKQLKREQIFCPWTVGEQVQIFYKKSVFNMSAGTIFKKRDNMQQKNFIKRQHERSQNRRAHFWWGKTMSDTLWFNKIPWGGWTQLWHNFLKFVSTRASCEAIALGFIIFLSFRACISSSCTTNWHPSI